MYTLNGIQVSIDEFPTRALVLYQNANSSAPNRAINTLGMARANLQIGNNNEAVRLYEVLITQMNSSNDSDPIFSEEALDITLNHNSSTTDSITVQYSTATTMNTTVKYNSASTNKKSFLLSIFILCIFYN